MQDHLLGPFGASSRRHALDTLTQPRRRGAAGHRGRRRSRPDAVTFADGEVLPCRTLVWAAGVRANPLADRARPRAGPRPGASWSSPDLRVPGRTASGRSATSRPPRTRRATSCRSWRRWRCRRAGTSPGRSGGWPRASPPSRSATGTRAPWPPSAAGRRWPSCPAASTSAAARPGWPGSGCTSCSSWASATAPSVLLNWAWNYFTWDRGPRLLLRPDADPDLIVPAMTADAATIRARHRALPHCLRR